MSENNKLRGQCLCKFRNMFHLCTLYLRTLNLISCSTSQSLPIKESCMFLRLIYIFSVLNSICGHLLLKYIESTGSCTDSCDTLLVDLSTVRADHWALPLFPAFSAVIYSQDVFFYSKRRLLSLGAFGECL